MSARFETERTFWLKPRLELLAQTALEVAGAIQANVPIMAGLPVPDDRRQDLANEMVNDSSLFRQLIEQQLRDSYRFPEEIPEDQRTDEAERKQVEELLSQLDQLAMQATNDRLIPGGGRWYGQMVPVGRIHFFSPAEGGASSVNLTLDSFRQKTPRSSRVFTIFAFLDEEDYRSDNPITGYKGKFKDHLRLYKDPEGTVASYKLWYKGESRPLTPWHCLTKVDHPLVAKIAAKAVGAFDRHERGEMERSFD